MSSEQPSRAADIVAQQIEGIIEAAQASADQVAQAAQSEAAQIKEQALASAEAELEAGRRSAIRMGEEARQDAAARIAEAQKAADDVLEEAKAVSSGLRQLGHLLTTHAERILRDVQGSHRAITADLRAAGQAGGGRSAEFDPGVERRPRAVRDPGATDRGNPFAELDPPGWVDETG